jgi:hypothetical protein
MSRKFSKELGRSLVVETLRHPGKMLAEAAVEALDHAVGLRPEGVGEPVGDGARGADSRQSSETKHLRREDQKQCTR